MFSQFINNITFHNLPYSILSSFPLNSLITFSGIFFNKWLGKISSIFQAISNDLSMSLFSYMP